MDVPAALVVLCTNYTFLSPLIPLFVALRALPGTCWCVRWTYHTLARVPSVALVARQTEVAKLA